MRKRSFLLLLATVPAWAQGPLSLKDAVALALAKNKALQAADAGAKASETRITQARSGYLPKLNYAESWARSNNPVFVFSSLLTQHQFGPQNFAIGPLNRPDALNNFQSLVTADQVIYDAGQTRNALRSAELTHDISGENSRKTRMDVIAGVVRTYYGAVLSAEILRAAEESVRSAEADLKRADTVRAAGMATDVDVLSIQVHLAAVKEEQIQRAADLDVARASLNDVLGLPLETPHDLTTPLAPAVYPQVDLAAYEQSAAKERPEARQSKLAE
ncbi:MAG: TolC family protein, partial [Acidobacteria bacterium]|nr:TolC family protein [Acidobacteriota bacterium]